MRIGDDQERVEADALRRQGQRRELLSGLAAYGREFLENLRADPKTASIPVLMLTANPNGAVGADVIMRKPFSNSEIVERVESLAGGS